MSVVNLIAQSRYLADWIDNDFVWSGCPDFVDQFQPYKTLDCLQAATVVDGDEVCELVVPLVVVSLDGGVLDGAVHSLDLTVDPWMSRLGQAMVDMALGAGVSERVRREVFAQDLSPSLLKQMSEQASAVKGKWMLLLRS